MIYTVMDGDTPVVVIEAETPTSAVTSVRAASPDFSSQAEYGQELADMGANARQIGSRMGYDTSVVEGDMA